MENSDINFNNPVVQLEVMKERLRHAEEKNSQLEEKNSQLEEGRRQDNVTIGRLEEKLEQAKEDYHNIRVTLEVNKQRLTHAEQTVNQSSQNTARKNRQAKWRVFLASIFFAIASVLTGIGGSQIASNPPNAFGEVLIGLGILAYVVATTLTILLA